MLPSQQKILEATLSLVHELGLESTPTAKISERAKVATGTLFHHYKNKQTLFEAVHKYILEDYFFHLMGYFDYPPNQVQKQLKKALRASVDYWSRNPTYHSFIHQISTSGYYSVEMREQEFQGLESRLGKAFKRALKKGVLKQYDYQIILRLVFRSIFQISGLVLDTEDPLLQKEYRKQGIRFVWSAIENTTKSDRSKSKSSKK